jgi:hypothetical protein
MDHSNQGMKVEIFEKIKENMPPKPNLGDLVLIRSIRVSTCLPVPAVLLLTS